MIVYNTVYKFVLVNVLLYLTRICEFPIIVLMKDVFLTFPIKHNNINSYNTVYLEIKKFRGQFLNLNTTLIINLI